MRSTASFLGIMFIGMILLTAVGCQHHGQQVADAQPGASQQDTVEVSTTAGDKAGAEQRSGCPCCRTAEN